jgi:hypothetical protein
MNPLILGPLFELGGSIINRMFPDPAEKARAELELLKMTQAGDLQQILAQLEINAKEAQHPSMFVAGARPFILWVCGFGFLWATIGRPVAVWVALAKGWPLPPEIDADVLMYVLGGLLGLGGFRSYEKVRGVASK